MDSLCDATVDALSRSIMRTLTIQRNEECYPDHNPDFMDSKIANAKKRVEMLRKMRNDFEDEMSKPLGSRT